MCIVVKRLPMYRGPRLLQTTLNGDIEVIRTRRSEPAWSTRYRQARLIRTMISIPDKNALINMSVLSGDLYADWQWWKKSWFLSLLLLTLMAETERATNRRKVFPPPSFFFAARDRFRFPFFLLFLTRLLPLTTLYIFFLWKKLHWFYSLGSIKRKKISGIATTNAIQTLVLVYLAKPPFFSRLG